MHFPVTGFKLSSLLWVHKLPLYTTSIPQEPPNFHNAVYINTLVHLLQPIVLLWTLESEKRETILKDRECLFRERG